MTTLQTKTLDELVAMVRGAIRGHIDGADVATGRDYDISARMVAAGVMLNQQQALENAKDAIPSENSSAEGIANHAAAKGLLTPLAARAIGKLQVTGSVLGAEQPIGSELVHADGTKFRTRAGLRVLTPAWSGKTIAGGTTPARLILNPDTTDMAVDRVFSVGIGGVILADPFVAHVRAIKRIVGGTTAALDLYEALPGVPLTGRTVTNTIKGAVVEIEAVDVGASGNKQVGDALTFSSPATGIDATARILELGGGGDDETMLELVGRVLATWAQHPSGGNQEYIRTRARETPSIRIADAVVYPGLRGLGTVDIIPIGVRGARHVGQLVADAIAAELAQHLSPHLDVNVEPIELSSAETNVDVTVTTGIGFERDFIHSGFSIAASPVSTTSRIFVTTDPSQLVAGNRMLVQLFVQGRWRVYVVEVVSRATVGSDKSIDVRLVEGGGPLPIAPIDSDPTILPSGPLVPSILSVLEDLFDSFGPSRKQVSAQASYERHPDPSIAFDDTLRPFVVSGRIAGIPGAVACTVNAPTTDVQPDAPNVVRRGRTYIRFQEI